MIDGETLKSQKTADRSCAYMGTGVLVREVVEGSMKNLKEDRMWKVRIGRQFSA